MENTLSISTEDILNSLSKEDERMLAALRQDIQDGLDSGGSAALDFEALRAFVHELSVRSAQ